MAAYSAVASFGQLLINLLESNEFPPNCAQEDLQILSENVETLQSCVEAIYPAPKDKREIATVLENEIRIAIYKAQDAFEPAIIKSSISDEDQSSTSIEDQSSTSISISMEVIKESIDTVAKKAKEIADEISGGKAARTAVNSLRYPLSILSRDFPEETIKFLQEKVDTLDLSVKAIYPAPKDKRNAAATMEKEIIKAISKAQVTLKPFIKISSSDGDQKSTPESMDKSSPSDGDQSCIPVSMDEMKESINTVAKKAKDLADKIMGGEAARSAIDSFCLLVTESEELLPNCPKETLQFLRENVESLKSSVKEIYPAPKEKRNAAAAMEEEITEAIYKAHVTFKPDISKSSPSDGDQSSTSKSMDKIKESIATVAMKAEDLAHEINDGKAARSAVNSFSLLLSASKKEPLNCPQEILKILSANVDSLKSSVKEIYPTPKEKRDVAAAMEKEITEAISKAQVTLKPDISKSLSPDGDQSSTPISMDEIKESIRTVAEKANKLAEEIKKILKARPVNTEKKSESVFVTTDFKIVGQDEDKLLLEGELMNTAIDELTIVAISGMPGIGKTTLARSIYDDPKINTHFPVRAWVTVTQDYNVGDIFGRLLGTMKQNNQPMENRGQGSTDDRNLAALVKQNLYEKKYLVVIDDMWEEAVWDKVKHSLPDDRKGSRIILTSRLPKMVEYAIPKGGIHHQMRTLTDAESWQLLSHVAFQGKPDESFKDIGTKIGKSCGGLPLSITVVGGLLSQEEKSKDYWDGIAEDVNGAVKKGKEAESYKEILALSYIHLPSELKGCFLYVGLFPEDSEILISKLTMLWIAEGFLKPSIKSLEMETKAKDFLKNLIDRNLLSVRIFGTANQVKACGMHDTLRDLAVQESDNEKFFHSIRRYTEELAEGAEVQRRVSVHKNIFMCLEKVYEATKKIEGARSLLYVGPHHHHPLPFSLTFDLLRVFDAFTVYFIEFPHDVIKLIHLRYLSLTYNGKLPSSLNKLRKLQALLVRRQPKIIFVGMPFLPDELWEMSELRHLVMTETDLPLLSSAKLLDPNSVLLQNLQTLLNVSATSCPKEVLKHMPNLKKVGMWMESPNNLEFHINDLVQLDSFKFTVLNPVPGKQVNFQPQFMLPQNLTKLTLSGCGLPWKEMNVVMQLPLLAVLKLRELAFHGDVWRLEKYDRFSKLKYLLIEYLNLQIWDAKHFNFPSLERLILKHNYDLEVIHPEIGYIGGLRLIDMVDCSPEAVECVEDIKEEQKDNKDLQVRIYSSWK